MSRPQTFTPLPGADERCALCTGQGGVLAWSDAHWRVVRIEDADFPAYYRVVANHHIVEFTDLSILQRQRCMALVGGVERVLRDQLAPLKVNLAALGNMTAHLHWHVIARFGWDSHYPQPIWGVRQRKVVPDAASRLPLSLPALDDAVAQALGELS